MSMTFFRKVANSNILADVIEIPKSLRNKKVEILIFPYENLDDEEIIIQRGKNTKGMLEKYKKEAGGEFDEEILSDLISQGLSGEELLQEFKEIRHQIK